MTKIIEVNDCMECTLSFRRLDAKLHCSKYFEKIIPETIFDNDPPDAPIPDWCPLENKAIGTVSLADIEKNCERIDSEVRADERKEVYAEISKDLNEAVILHNEIKPNGNVMVKGGFIAELQKKYVTKLRTLVIPSQSPEGEK